MKKKQQVRCICESVIEIVVKKAIYKYNVITEAATKAFEGEKKETITGCQFYETLPVASSDIVPCAIEHETSIAFGSSSADAAKRKAVQGSGR